MAAVKVKFVPKLALAAEALTVVTVAAWATVTVAAALVDPT
jgi:hypothetical protein